MHFSNHAPNRNPAEISFAAVDRRLGNKQREEILSIAKHYDGDNYYIEHNGSVCVIDVYDHSIAYVERDGRVIPCH